MFGSLPYPALSKTLTAVLHKLCFVLPFTREMLQQSQFTKSVLVSLCEGLLCINTNELVSGQMNGNSGYCILSVVEIPSSRSRVCCFQGWLFHFEEKNQDLDEKGTGYEGKISASKSKDFM